ncbi:MAG: hypothetical protein H0W89_04175 [Candidatus Levybacteria bacterium]|nr:hypothetical protein [Candidatus Levybacteria bacterium]
MREAGRYSSAERAQVKIKKRRLRASAAVLSAVLVAGCGDGIETGVVYDKDHKDAYTSITIIGRQLYPTYHPESWGVDIAQCPDRVPPTIEEVERDCLTQGHSVTEDIYSQTQIGDIVDFSNPQSS